MKIFIRVFVIINFSYNFIIILGLTYINKLNVKKYSIENLGNINVNRLASSKEEMVKYINSAEKYMMDYDTVWRELTESLYISCLFSAIMVFVGFKISSKKIQTSVEEKE